MPTNRLLTFSDDFVISCGTVSFDIPRQKVLLVHYRDKNIFILPKGRKNQGESLESAAIRETKEETGYSCDLLPHSTPTRATALATTPHTEPIAAQQWVYEDGVRKLIFWFLASVDSTETPCAPVEDGEKFDVHWCGFDEGVQRLSFEDDRKLVEKAIGIVQSMD